MKKINPVVTLAAITALTIGSPLESLTPNSPASLLLKDYCSKFTTVSAIDAFPVFEFINLLPNIELKIAVDALKNDVEQENFEGKSAFGLLQVLLSEMQPEESKTLQMKDLSSENCGICYDSKVELFYEVCGFGICRSCCKKVGSYCPGCRLLHRFAYNVEFFQLDKSYYPFVAIPALSEKPIFNESIKKVYSSLTAWVGKLSKPSFLQNINPFSQRRKQIERQTKATIKILQIFDILQHHSLWEFKEPLVVLQTSMEVLSQMISNADPKRSALCDRETEECEVIKKTFSEMKNSFLEIIYFIQWLSNIFIRQCYHVSDLRHTNEEYHISMIQNFQREFQIP